jgi:hypothetical protein
MQTLHRMCAGICTHSYLHRPTHLLGKQQVTAAYPRNADAIVAQLTMPVMHRYRAPICRVNAKRSLFPRPQ